MPGLVLSPGYMMQACDRAMRGLVLQTCPARCQAPGYRARVYGAVVQLYHIAESHQCWICTTTGRSPPTDTQHLPGMGDDDAACPVKTVHWW
ncbi:uncharacterized protein LOC144158619 isoform X2 [Haemaphysalis longicornis]